MNDQELWQQYMNNMPKFDAGDVAAGKFQNYITGFDAWKQTQQLNNKVQDYQDQLLNFRSPLYQQYRSYLGQATPTMGTNALLAPLVASGGNYAASQYIASNKANQFNTQRNDFLNKAVSGFAAGNLGQMPSLFGVQGQNQNNYWNYLLGQKELQLKEQAMTPGVLDFLSAPLGFFAGGIGDSLGKKWFGGE